MENFSFERYGSIKTALKELGFIVDFVEKQAKKTIITISHYEQNGKNPVSAKKQEAS